MKEIKVRRARPQDAQIIASFNAAMAEETEGKKLELETALAGTKAVLADPEKGFYLVAEAGGELVGQMMVTHEWSDWRNADFWWLQSVYVKPEWRRQGVFRALWLQMETLARREGRVCGIRLYTSKSNTVAQRTYQSLGMNESRYLLFEKMLP